MIFPGFVGPSYQSISPKFDVQRSLNMYPEVSGSGSSKSVSALLGTPGLQTFITLPKSGIRALSAGGNRLFAVANDSLYEVFADVTATDRSALPGAFPLINDGNPALMYQNGNQLGISSGGKFYCDNGSGPAPVGFPAASGTVVAAGTTVVWASGDHFDSSWIGNVIVINGVSYIVTFVASPFALFILGAGVPAPGVYAYSISPIITASTLAFLDGYYIVSHPNSRQFNISAINDGLTWDPLDYATKEAYPDYIARVFTLNEQLWIFGMENATEVWQNTGAANFPFQRIPGALINYGCAAPYSVAKLGAGLAWVGIDTDRGGLCCVFAQGYTPVIISTPAVENEWGSYATVADAVGFSYMENKHQFYVISFPTGNRTWCYDLTTNQWHERGWWNGSGNGRQRQTVHQYSALAAHGIGAAITAKHWVGDWQNGKIYYQLKDLSNDAGTQIQRIRTCPHLSDDDNWTFYGRFWLDMQVPGGGIAAINPTLDWSDDGGFNFGTVHTVGGTSTLGRNARVIWRKLGKSRDRVFRIIISDDVPIALINAYLELEKGEP